MPELRPPPHPFLLASPFTPHSFLRLFVPSPDPRLSRPTPWVIGACGRTRTLWGDTGLAVPEPQPPGGGRGKCWAPTTPLPQLGDPRPLLPRVSYTDTVPLPSPRAPHAPPPRAPRAGRRQSPPPPLGGSAPPSAPLPCPPLPGWARLPGHVTPRPVWDATGRAGTGAGGRGQHGAEVGLRAARRAVRAGR